MFNEERALRSFPNYREADLNLIINYFTDYSETKILDWLEDRERFNISQNSQKNSSETIYYSSNDANVNNQIERNKLSHQHFSQSNSNLKKDYFSSDYDKHFQQPQKMMKKEELIHDNNYNHNHNQNHIHNHNFNKNKFEEMYSKQSEGNKREEPKKENYNNNNYRVEKEIPTVGDKKDLKLLTEEYHNSNILTKISDLINNSHFSQFRSIRGDGNCFYRACATAMIELMIDDENFYHRVIKIFTDNEDIIGKNITEQLTKFLSVISLPINSNDVKVKSDDQIPSKREKENNKDNNNDNKDKSDIKENKDDENDQNGQNKNKSSFDSLHDKREKDGDVLMEDCIENEIKHNNKNETDKKEEKKSPIEHRHISHLVRNLIFTFILLYLY